jgi:uncharacterized repeat protein (TIGR01451 family)
MRSARSALRAVIAASILVMLAAGTVAGGVPEADMQITKTDSPDPVVPGGQITYTITVRNNGPQNADNITVTDVLAGNVTFVSLSTPGGWSATTPAPGTTGIITMTIGTLSPAAGDQVFILVVTAPNEVTSVDNNAAVTATTFDPNQGNESAVTSTTVGLPPTPVASVPDAAMSPPGAVTPTLLLGVLAILAASLVAVARIRAERTR